MANLRFHLWKADQHHCLPSALEVSSAFQLLSFSVATPHANVHHEQRLYLPDYSSDLGLPSTSSAGQHRFCLAVFCKERYF